MAYDHRSQYPYLSDKDWSRYKHDPVKLENVNKVKQSDLEDKWANFSLSENNFNVEGLPQSNERDNLRIVIIGKTGQGKSATANTILGKEKFKEDFTATSVSRESRCFTELVDGRKISVMDTPGLQHTYQSNRSILVELARMTTLFPDGVHAFVYVMNMADPRFTAEDRDVLDLIEKTFGGGFKKYCLLVFSHGDSTLRDDIDLDTYRKRQMEIAQVTREHPTQQNVRKDQREQDQDKTDFANLLDDLSWRMLAIENKTSILFEKAHYRKQIAAMVDRMSKLNSPEIYTNDIFDKAKQKKEGLRQKGLRKGWDPLIMSKVETMIAANPNISREELNATVNGQLQKEILDKMIELKKKEEEFEKERMAEEKRLQEEKSVDQEKRLAEEKERREIKVYKERFQKEEQERQDIREREYYKWQSNREQQKIERQNQFLREETERKRRVAKEQEKHRRGMQLQRDDLQKTKKEEFKEFTIRQQRLQEEWEKREREDQQRRQERDEDKLKRREEEESRRMMQIEQEKDERQERLRREVIELEKMILKHQEEESKRQMKIKEEDKLRRKMEEEERKQFELRLTEEKEERLRERKELERFRLKQLQNEELERQEKRKQDDKERERRIKREQEEREEAERERIKQAEEELNNLRRDIENRERLQRERQKQTEEIAEEHTSLLEKSYSGFASSAEEVFGWFK